MPSTVNRQIVDAVTITQAGTVGGAPSLAMGMFYQMESQAFAMGLQNLVSSQRGCNQVGEAMVAAACARMLQASAGSAVPAP